MFTTLILAAIQGQATWGAPVIAGVVITFVAVAHADGVEAGRDAQNPSPDPVNRVERARKRLREIRDSHMQTRR